MRVLDVGPHKSPPHPNIDLHANAGAAQLELTVQMVANLSSSQAATTTIVPFHFRETVTALLNSTKYTNATI